jgi:2-polyprenyl-6-methoxyphenol hydroxylase-like FAD-dependent oxidoreductase
VLLERVEGILRGAWVLPVEQHRVMVSLVDFSGKAELADLEQLRSFAAGFSEAPQLLAALSREPLTPQPARFRSRANRLVHFERIPMPANYFVVGDAFCHTSPVLALGITAATTTVNILADVVGGARGAAAAAKNAARVYHRRAAATLEHEMALARTFARRYAATPPPPARGPLHRLGNSLVDLAVSVFATATTRDPRLHGLYLAVRNKVASPMRLLAPRSLWLIARALARP